MKRNNLIEIIENPYAPPKSEKYDSQPDKPINPISDQAKQFMLGFYIGEGIDLILIGLYASGLLSDILENAINKNITTFKTIFSYTMNYPISSTALILGGILSIPIGIGTLTHIIKK